MTRGQKIAILAVIAVIVFAVVAAKNKNANTTTMARVRKGFLKSDFGCSCPEVPLGPHQAGKPISSESVTVTNPRGHASDAAGMLCDYIGTKACGGISFDKSGKTAMVFGGIRPAESGPIALDGDQNWTTMFAQ